MNILFNNKKINLYNNYINLKNKIKNNNVIYNKNKFLSNIYNNKYLNNILNKK